MATAAAVFAICAAGLAIATENPLANLKTHYAAGLIKPDPETNRPVRVGGVDYEVKKGVVYEGVLA